MYYRRECNTKGVNSSLPFPLLHGPCVQGNILTGTIPSLMPYNKLFTAHLAYNQFSLIGGGAIHVTDLNLASNL